MRKNDLNEVENALLEYIIFALRRIASMNGFHSSLTEAPFVARLEDFALIFRNDQGLQAMKNYIDWSEAKGCKAKEIFETIAHDVFGRNERCFDPRTSSYIDVKQEELDALWRKRAKDESLVAINCKDCGGLFGHRGNCKQLQK